MVIPTPYDVTITIDGVDATCFIPLDSMAMDLYPKQVSTFKFRVENPVGIVPERNHQVIVVADSLPDTPTVFLGYIRERITLKEGNGINVYYECEAADSKILLQRTVLDIESLQGTDADILQSLLNNAYPDLSDEFDFLSNVEGFATGLDLPTGNKNVLDALNDLATLAGADYSLDVPAGSSTSDTITFDTGGLSYTIGDNFTAGNASLGVGLGNPGNCAYYNAASAQFEYMSVSHDFGADKTITAMDWQFYYNNIGGGTPDLDFQIWLDGVMVESFSASGGWAERVWIQHGDTFPNDPATDWTTNVGQVLELRMRRQSSGGYTVDYRIDNIGLSYSTGTGSNTPTLNWGDTPPLSDFDFDIQLGDEYGFDFDFSEGDYDDFNSITVVGGNSEEAIDWTYPNQDNQVHIDLETAIDDLVVYENTGSEGSPTWSALTVGVYGTDTLGTVDVVYDKLDHWLLFDTAPPNFDDAIRVTGNILRPIRVRVEDVESGEPTYATVIENKSITSVDQAVAIADSQLNKRNAVKSLNFKTYEPGLVPGQQITVTDSARGLDESLVIQHISVKWLGGDRAIFDVECGTDEVIGVDTIIANNERRSRDTSLAAGATVVTYQAVTDRYGDNLFDRYSRTVRGISA